MTVRCKIIVIFTFFKHAIFPKYYPDYNKNTPNLLKKKHQLTYLH